MADVLTPELIADLWSPSDPRLSPDGTRVAWTAVPNGKAAEHQEQGIWVAAIDGSAPARRWTHGADDQSPRWSPDGTQLAFLSDRKERGTHGLYLLDTTGGEALALVVRERSIAAFAWAPERDRIAFLAPAEPTDEDKRRDKERDDADVFGEREQLNQLWLVDAADGEPECAWAPDKHVAALAWSPDGTRIAALVRRSPRLDDESTTSVCIFEPQGQRVTRVCSAPYAGGLCWLGSDTLAYQAPHDGPQSSLTVWAVPSTRGTPPRVVGTGAEEPRCTLSLASAPADGRLVVSVAEGLDNSIEWLDVKTGVRTPISQLSGEVEGLDLALTEQGPLIAVLHLEGPVETVLAGRPGQLHPVSDHASSVADVRFGAVEPLYCRATDATMLDAVVVRPTDAGEGPWPTAVLVHGGPYGRAGLWTHVHALDWGQLLASNGFAVVYPNYRGGYGHGNAFATSVRGDMGGAEWGDVMAIVDAAVDAGIADPERLGIGGWSQGGFLTAWAVTATDRFKAGVMGAGVSDWGMMAATSDLPQFEAALAGDSPWDGPGPHHAAARSPISYASRRTTPLLILHGARDERVPASQAIAFHRALKDQEAPVQLVTYPREPHGIKERQHQIDVQRRVLNWFSRYVRDA